MFSFIFRYRQITVLIFLGIFININTLTADGLIVIPHPVPSTNPFPLEVVYHNVNVEIDGQFALTSVDQSFYNPTSQRLEGYYIFPIPKGAVLKDFKMYIDGKLTSAELLDADKARKIYEDIVRQMRDPALLEYSDQGLFKVRIFPIEPRSEKKISLSYREIIKKEFGMYEYIYPLNTEKFSAKPLKNVSIKVNLKTDDEIKTTYSPTHEVEIIRKDKYGALITYEEENVKPEIDFKLYFDTDNSKFGLSLLSYREPGEDGYFFFSAAPAFEFDNSEIIEKDITFILDVSGSMAGTKLKQAKKALTYCVENLNDGDRFQIIRFSTEAYALFSKHVEADKTNREKAEKFITELKPVGGTNIEEALQLALTKENDFGRPHMIIFITDGKPTIGETNEDDLVKNVVKLNDEKTRIFTFGIGNEINTHLLDKIADLTKAARSYISPTEDIEIKISHFYDKVHSPVLTDLSLSFSDNIKVYQTSPKELPDLFMGSNMIIFGRYKGNGEAEIKLTGMLNGERQRYVLDAQFVNRNTSNDFIPSLWASRRIGYLLDLVRLYGESKEVKDEITDLARRFGIVTPYTSYLIMEDERIRLHRNEIAQEFQTLSGAGVPQDEMIKKYKVEEDALEDKEGEASVRASEEFRDLNLASNIAQTKQGGNRLDYSDGTGNIRNLSQQVKTVQGRAVYQSDEFWVDSELQKHKSAKIHRIKFASDEYFNLLSENKEAAQFLALGQNVRFYYDNKFYEIFN